MRKAVIIGLRREGKMSLVPHQSAKIEDGDMLVVIARAQQDALSLSRPPPNQQGGHSRTAVPMKRPNKPSHILVCGWDGLMAKVIDDVLARAPKGTRLTLMTDVKPPQFQPGKVKGCILRHVAGSPFAYSSITQVLSEDIDAIVLMPDMVTATEECDDSLYLSTMLCIKDHYAQSEQPLPRVIGVAHNEDIREISEELYVEMGGTRCEMLVSSSAIGSLMAQTARTGLVDDVYEELHDYTMQSWDAKSFVTPGEPTTFAAIMERASQGGHIALGYFLADEAGVEVNPPKDTTITLKADDQVVIITRA